MSSPSPDPQKLAVDHTYQSSEASDHGLLSSASSHVHACNCCNEKQLETPPPPPLSKTEPIHHHHHHHLSSTHCLTKSPHHHNLIGLNQVPPPVPPPTTPPTNHIHPMNQSVHVHVHATSPKTGNNTKLVPTSCTCHHLQDDIDDGITEIDNNLTTNRKLEADDRIEVSPLPPALPPRPPPRPRFDGSLNSRHRMQHSNPNHGGIRKYVFWCCVCGGLATILGALFLAVYFLLRSYTSTLGYFETIPTFVPATMLILTGLCVMSLARRKNRYSYLIKVCGLCCLVCALTCVLVTITTTVIHMNRLQTLRECVYTQKTRTCTCYSVLLETHSNADDGMRFIFDSTPDCEVIHGALYSCLRAMFGLSVSGILVCIFSCMLVYQLLSHEKKKMYWEQLELRCRSFYQQQTSGPPTSSHGSMRGPPPPPVVVPPSTYCSCCEECRYPPLPIGPQVYPWDNHHSTERFWTPGRIGNFYSPNPGEDGPPIADTSNRERTASGWNWRRLPWSRGNNAQTDPQRDNSLTYQVGGGSSADSQYGFSNRNNDMLQEPNTGSSGSYSVLDNRPPVGGVYVWGPPPPYSNPNSPARRNIQSPNRYHHIHHHAHTHAHESHCQMSEENHFRNSRRNRQHINNNNNNKDNYENTAEVEIQQHQQQPTPQQQQPQQAQQNDTESTDSSSCIDRITHSLPVRKIKKKNDMGSVKATTTTQQQQQQQCGSSGTSVQTIFNQNSKEEDKLDDDNYHEPISDKTKIKSDTQQCRFLPRLQGVENAAFQKQENTSQKPETSESEVYFADVSSCCNISVRNDGQDSSLYDEALEAQKPHLNPEANFQENAAITNTTTAAVATTTTMTVEDEDYLAHRMGNRQMSIRSRMPFPLPVADEINEFKSDLLKKDLSQNSLGGVSSCSTVQTPLTETTDDAITPVDCCNFFNDNQQHHYHHHQCIEQNHRTFTSNTKLDHFLAPDAQYEIIQEQEAFRPNSSNLTNTISGLNLNYYNQNNFNNTNSPKSVPPKSLNLNSSQQQQQAQQQQQQQPPPPQQQQQQAQPTNRRNIGSNISTLIQNLGGNPVGLLYSEANDDEIQTQGSHSDGTMDSGWHSGSEKTENKPQETSSPVDV